MFALLTDESLSPHLTEAQKLHQTGEWDAAEALYYALLAQHPTDPMLLYHLGTLYACMGNDYAAAEVLQHVVNQLPDFAAACCELAAVLRSLGRVQEANGYYRRAELLDSSTLPVAPDFELALAPNARATASLSPTPNEQAVHVHRTNGGKREHIAATKVEAGVR